MKPDNPVEAILLEALARREGRLSLWDRIIRWFRR